MIPSSCNDPKQMPTEDPPPSEPRGCEGPTASEVAATRQAAAAVRVGRLVNREALGSRREQLNTCSVRHLEAAADVAVTFLEPVDCHLEVCHTEDQNCLVTVKVFGQHQPR